MIFTPTTLPGSFIIDLSPRTDERGWFARTYCKDEFSQIGHSGEWLQLNQSFTAKKGSIRGMHYQIHPYKEIKLVRCIAGAVYDVIIDLRENSSTFLKWFSVELSHENRRMLYIPEGFAHGFQTLSNNCEMIYHHSEFYAPDAEASIKFNDPAINIQWPMAVTDLSEKDQKSSFLSKTFKGI